MSGGTITFAECWLCADGVEKATRQYAGRDICYGCLDQYVPNWRGAIVLPRRIVRLPRSYEAPRLTTYGRLEEMAVAWKAGVW